MTGDQALAFAVLAGALVLFVWGRWRYDIVAMLALLAVVAGGLVPVGDAFNGFAHPAIITVAAVLIISRGLQNAGIADAVMGAITPLSGRPLLQIFAQTVAVTFLSAFMNNVGALALMLPIALRNAYKDGYPPAMSLMPLAFGSLLGGLTTLIGTPPNIIVSTFRARVEGAPYAMFDFLPVGGMVALTGVAFVVLIGWRLLPRDRKGAPNPQTLLDIADYVTEAQVGNKCDGRTVREIEHMAKDDITILGILRGGDWRLAPAGDVRVNARDVLIIEAHSGALKQMIDATGMTLVGDSGENPEEHLRSEDVDVVEAIVARRSRLVGQTPKTLRLRSLHGINLLAVAREGRRVEDRLHDVRFRFGDVLLLQGPKKTMSDTLNELNCLPLKERAVEIGRPRRLLLAVALFALGIGLTIAGLVPVQLAFTGTALGYVLTSIVTPEELYDAVDWPVIVLLGALIPVGGALETTGGTTLIAEAIFGATNGLSPIWALILVFVATMCVSDVLNNNATAVLMAPVAYALARQLQVNPDAFLMATAIGASCAFLTPIGHQSNTLVMEPGGYKFSDYWRMGLPLEIIILIVAVPMILIIWPL